MVKMLKSPLAKARQSIVAPAKSRSQQARIRGSSWMTIRSRILARDGGMCQACKREGRVTLASEVDHVKRLEDGGSNDDANLESICTPCHKAKTAAENRGGTQ